MLRNRVGLRPDHNAGEYGGGNDWGLGLVFLPDEEAIARAIRSVNQNPPRAGLKPQHWSFVTPQTNSPA